LKSLRIQQAARYLCPSNSALGADLRIPSKVEFDTPLCVQPQQQTRKNQYPKKRIVKHFWISPTTDARAKNTAPSGLLHAMTHSGYDRLFMGSPLRRSGVSKVIAAALLAILALATLVQLVVFIGMPPGLFSVFLRALALSSLLALVPLAILWFLDRREREAPWLFVAAFLWGGLIATALALPFNTAFFKLIDEWLTHHPMLAVLLGPEAPMMKVIDRDRYSICC
jgi:hypothetical protein